MADIISIDDKIALSKEKKDAMIRKRKIQAVRKIFQCTQCAYKCEKCGAQLDSPAGQTREGGRQSRLPYRLCEECAEEYTDYIEHHKGGGDPDCYWRNEDWMELWRSWIAYQGTLDRYMKSKEFLMLIQELKQNRPEE
jgi:hypothetical protein